MFKEMKNMIETPRYVAFGSEFGGTYYGVSSYVLGAKKTAEENKSTDCTLMVYAYEDTMPTAKGCRVPKEKTEPVTIWDIHKRKWLWNTL